MSTKYRKRILRWGLYNCLQNQLKTFVRKHPEIEIDEVNHDKDHIHLLISVPPKLSISEVVRFLKCNTSREIRKKFKFLDKVYFGSDGIWSEGYFVSTVGADEADIKWFDPQYPEDKKEYFEPGKMMLFIGVFFMLWALLCFWGAFTVDPGSVDITPALR